MSEVKPMPAEAAEQEADVKRVIAAIIKAQQEMLRTPGGKGFDLRMQKLAEAAGRGVVIQALQRVSSPAGLERATGASLSSKDVFFEDIKRSLANLQGGAEVSNETLLAA